MTETPNNQTPKESETNAPSTDPYKIVQEGFFIIDQPDVFTKKNMIEVSLAAIPNSNSPATSRSLYLLKRVTTSNIFAAVFIVILVGLTWFSFQKLQDSHQITNNDNDIAASTFESQVNESIPSTSTNTSLSQFVTPDSLEKNNPLRNAVPMEPNVPAFTSEAADADEIYETSPHIPSTTVYLPTEQNNPAMQNVSPTSTVQSTSTVVQTPTNPVTTRQNQLPSSVADVPTKKVSPDQNPLINIQTPISENVILKQLIATYLQKIHAFLSTP